MKSICAIDFLRQLFRSIFSCCFIRYVSPGTYTKPIAAIYHNEYFYSNRFYMHQDRETIHYNLSLPDFLPNSKSSLQFAMPKPNIYAHSVCYMRYSSQTFSIDLYTKREWNYIHCMPTLYAIL